MRKMLIAALALAAVAAPAALAGPGKGHGDVRDKVVTFEFKGVVTADASAEALNLEVRQANKHGRRALDGATSFVVKLGPKTKVVGLRGKAMSFSDLKMGDKVTILLRAKRGTKAGDLPVARIVVDRGVAKNWTPPVVEPPVVVPPVVDPPVVEPPVVTPPPDFTGEIG